ncbi:MAG: nickel-dependent hydrogenase large subunit [Adlercreutzia equolifaciens]
MAVVEPARLFESMVRGRSFEEVPYIASRVCGICSSSHVVTDLRAIEQVFGVEVTDRTEALRELLLYGSYLQNHGTHLFVFAAPDFLGHKSVFPLAEGNPELFERALGLKALGNELCTLVRPVHPSHHGGGGRIHPRDLRRRVPSSGRGHGRHARICLGQRRSVPRLRHRGRRPKATCSPWSRREPTRCAPQTPCASSAPATTSTPRTWKRRSRSTRWGIPPPSSPGRAARDGPI